MPTPRSARAVLLVGLLGACADAQPSGTLQPWTPADHTPAAAAPTTTPAAEPEDDRSAAAAARQAAAIYEALCAGCHGAEGRGGGPTLPGGVQIPDLSAAAFQDARTDEALATAVAQGQGAFMPAFADRLTPMGIAALVGHVRRLGGREAVTATPAETPTAAPTAPADTVAPVGP